MIELSPRDYQKEIFQTALNSNTLVVLPTGLGKTLIALMLSIERLKKYPMSKILFLAPTKPLVEQHYEYFKKLLPELFAELQLFTGEVPAASRKKFWQTSEIIFSTPQCIANDLEKSLYNLNDLSLLIIDEAHRCLKNYDYTKVVSFYKRQAEKAKQRILGLTASPGSDPDKIKEICAHLAIEEIELRSRDSPDVEKYLQNREFEKVEVEFPKEFIEIRVLLKRLFDSRVDQLINRRLLFGPVSKVSLLKLQNNLARRAGSGDGNSLAGMSLTAQAIKISHAIELLETQTLSGLDIYLKGLMQQAEEKKSKGVQYLVNSPEFQAAIVSLSHLLNKRVEHPKVSAVIDIVEREVNKDPKSKIIIFTQFRETAQKIVQYLNQNKKINSAIFIGQAKKANSGLSQKEQKKVIEDFKEGTLNVICATSIGEEGLDIPEVSAVIFYEPTPSAIRKIQRAGRTARLAPGRLVILITKATRDEINHYASGAREKKMYKNIELIKDELKKKKNITSLNKFIK